MTASREILNDMVKVLIGSGQMTPEIIMKLGMTAFESHLYVIRLIIENLDCLQYPAYSKMLRFLENLLEQQDKQKSQIVAGAVLHQLLLLDIRQCSQAFLERIMTAIYRSGYTDPFAIHEGAADIFFSESALMKALLVSGFTVPVAHLKHAKTNFLALLAVGDQLDEQLEVFKIIAEFDLKKTLIAIKNKISEHDFVISGRGVYISQINKSVSAGAANIYFEIDRVLTADISFVDSYSYLVANASVELAPVAGNGWLGMFGFGQQVRDASTIEIYSQLSNMIKEGERIRQEFLSLKNIVDQLEVSSSSSSSGSLSEREQPTFDSKSNPEIVLDKSAHRPRSYSACF